MNCGLYYELFGLILSPYLGCGVRCVCHRVLGDIQMTAIKRGAVLALALAVAACAQQPKSIPFVKPAGTEIQTIGLLVPDMPKQASASLATSPGKNAANAAAGAGLIGLAVGLVIAGVDAGIESNRGDSLQELLDAQSFDAPDTFATALQASLEEKGYQVVSVPRSGQRQRGTERFQPTYTTPAGAEVDAFLDVIVEGYGYGAASTSSSAPFRPVVLVETRLVSAANKSVLMRDDVVYNPMGNGGLQNRVTIPPAPQYSFVDFDTLESAPEKATEGLDEALTKTADTIGTLLR